MSNISCKLVTTCLQFSLLGCLITYVLKISGSYTQGASAAAAGTLQAGDIDAGDGSEDD